jgi:hypothetical protein
MNQQVGCQGKHTSSGDTSVCSRCCSPWCRGGTCRSQDSYPLAIDLSFCAKMPELSRYGRPYGKFPRASPTKSLGIRGWTVLARSSREPRALTGKFSWVQGLRGGWRLVMTRRVVAAGALRPQEASPSSHFHSILR